ncbi:MAG: HNH endonuclease signature motif containing protein [Mycobacterium sp.]
MSSGTLHDREQIAAALDGYLTAFATLADMSFDALTAAELLTVLDKMEAVSRRAPTIGHRVLARLQREASPVALGAKSWRDVLKIRLRISAKDANRRLDEATDLGPRVALNGEPLAPKFDKVANAQTQGRINAEHVAVIRTFFTTLPGWVDPTTREQAETTLTRVAGGFGPDQLRKAATHLGTLIDQDGPEPDDAERARKRTITLGPQQADGTSRISGWIDPQLRAVLEPIQAKLAAPGMCNPEDDTPCIKGTPSQAQIDADRRSFGQRTHDAFTAMGRNFLSSGELGQHNGLPVTIIVSTTLQDLESGRGSAVTAGGTLVQMADVIRMGSHSHHYLVVFDKHTNEALYLGRSKRIAPAAHRIVLLSQQRGCTFPGCTVPGYGCQVHHINGWAKNNGQTNIDEEVLACGPDNRLAETGWTVHIRNGIAEWTPPPHLDTGQARINYYHHPERLLADPDDP